MFSVFYKPSIEKDLKSLQKQKVQLLLKKSESLAADPFPYNSAKLRGRESFYRIRVGDYRIDYSVQIEQKQILILTIQHRRNVYRDF